ncbi:hypothetical protein HPB52_022126 [Rhipicephalus sanguineus]|uniref:Gustatory receptor n=1 Tax=Rhipicephalus sanguineus TaxID=34632 RepID=A0A9D4PG13_RHISA|nr:hypothetical protein HPB52_022126 [Rhipicephalus sanguineus]
MWRVSGCLFVSNLNRRNLDRARVTWKSFYILYSLLCASILFSFRIRQIWQGTHNVSDSKGALTSSLLAIMRNVIGLESLVAFIVMSVRSEAILRFLRKASAFEASMKVPACHRVQRQYPLPYACHALAFASMTLYTLGHFGWSLITAYSLMTTAQILHAFYAIAANALYMASDYGNKATARAACEVLVDYIRIQVDILEQKRESRLSLRDVEDVRANMATIESLKEEINAALNPCILLFCLRSFSVICIGGYMLARLSFSQGISVLILFYLLSTAFALIDLAYIRFFYNTIDPRSMCLSGGGFFAINAKTLMHVAEAVVTYTVIFMQTGDAIINTFQPLTNSTDQQKVGLVYH